MNSSWRYLALMSWIYNLKDKFARWKEERRYKKIKKKKK